MKRKLTDLEQQFVKEAEANYFTVEYEDDGSPCAYGAPDTHNLFSLDVLDVQQERIGPDESLYYLRRETQE